MTKPRYSLQIALGILLIVFLIKGDMKEYIIIIAGIGFAISTALNSYLEEQK